MIAAIVDGIWANRFMLDSIWKPPQSSHRNGRVAQLAEQLTLNQ